MKRFLLFIFIASELSIYHAYGQVLSVNDFLSASSLSSRKFDSYISKKNFLSSGRWNHNDTVINSFSLKKKNKTKDTLQVTRIIETYQIGKDFSFAFRTSSKDEYENAGLQLQKMGFILGSDTDAAGTICSLYQRGNISVRTKQIIQQDTLYSLLFHQQELPAIANIRYAEDLLQFTSHEYLVSSFGANNVKKDVYAFTEKNMVKCSVLFPESNRQAVFIWLDEANFCRLSCIVVGGNISVGSTANYDKVIAENKWISKEGVHAGMRLNDLVRLNGKDFRLYGKNAEFPFMVVPENTGNINFKKNLVVLGCLNPNGSQLLDNKMISSDEMLRDNPGMYVFMLMLSPSLNK